MHSRTVMVAVAFLGVCFMSGTAVAGMLDEVFAQVDGSGWGMSREQAKQMLVQSPLLNTPEIVVVPAKVGRRDGTANFLFTKADQLYNMAWYWTLPVNEIKSARRLGQELVAALRAKYGRQAHTFTDGNPRKYKEAAKRSKDVAKTRDMLEELRREKGGELTVDEVQNALGKRSLMDMVPTNFHTTLDMWDEGALWVYVNLLCSTDGTCYLHMQFVSKHLTGGENYLPREGKMFAYSPMDRDEDIVVKSNAEMLTGLDPK